MTKISGSGLAVAATSAEIIDLASASAASAKRTTIGSKPKRKPIGPGPNGQTIVECSCTELTGHSAVDCPRCGGEGMCVE